MHKKFKKQISIATNHFKKVNKIITIFVILLLLSTVAASSVSSMNIGQRHSDEQTEDNVEETQETDDQPIMNSFTEGVNKLKKATQNVVEKVKNKASDIKRNFRLRNNGARIVEIIKSFISSIKGYFSLRTKASSGLSVYTNYAGSEKQTPLKWLTASRIDLNDDGKNDIKARYQIYPYFVRNPFAFSFNIRLIIEKLDGFSNLDDYEFFETYVQFTFPGLLNNEMAGNYIRFGYQSDNGQEIPDVCNVVYRYIPYFFHKEKPLHMAMFNPDKTTVKDLNLLFTYSTDSGLQDVFNIKLEPAPYTEITFGGLDGLFNRHFNYYSSSASKATIQYTRVNKNGSFNAGLIVDKISSFTVDLKVTPFSKGGGKIEYKRSSADPIDATLFFKKNASAYIYAEDIPQTVTLQWLPELDGLVQLSSSSPVKEIGIRNAMSGQDATAKAYVSDLPKNIELRWTLNFIEGNVDIFTDTKGCSAHVYATDFLGSGAQLYVDIETDENINFSAFWNMSDKYFGLKRTNINISISAELINLNGISADFYCEIKRQITEPFLIYFDKEDKSTEFGIELASKSFSVENLETNVYIPSFGNLSITLDKLEISKDSSISFEYSVEKSDNTTTVYVAVEITNGMYIENLAIWFNGSLVGSKNLIDTSGYWLEEFELIIHEANIEWGGDKANGYLFIHGGAGLTFTFNSIRKINGETIASASGSITFETDVGLNISWSTNETGNLSFDIVGGGAVILAGFNFNIKDKITVYIGKIMGSFNLNTKEKSGEILLYLSNAGTNFDLDFNIGYTNEKDIYFKAIIGANLDVGVSGYVRLSWKDGNFSIDASADGDFTGEILVRGLEFMYGNKSDIPRIEASLKNLVISAGIDLGFNLDFSDDTISFLSDILTTLSIENFDLYVLTDSIEASVDLDGFSITGSGYINLILINPEKGEKSKLKVVIYADANVGLDYLYVDIPLNTTRIKAELSFGIILLDGRLEFEIQGEEITVGVYFTVSRPLLIRDFHLNVNEGMLNMSWEKLLLLVNGVGKITFCKESLESIYINAVVDRFEFTNFELSLELDQGNSTKLKIDGEVTITSSGPLIIRANLGGCSNPYLQFIVDNGFIDVSGLNIVIGTEDSNTGVHGKFNPILKAGWENLRIDGSFVFDLRVKENPKDDKIINIGLQGKGGIILSNAEITGNIETSEGPGEFNIDLGTFNFELDNLTGSVINMTLNLQEKIFNVESFSASGAITNFEIIDFNTSFNRFYLPGIIFINITEIVMNFKGSGYFTLELSEPDENDIRYVTFEVSINDEDGYFLIDSIYMVVEPLAMAVDVKNFSLYDDTTFHAYAEMKSNYDIENLTSYFESLYFEAGCYSHWSLSKLYITGAVGIDNFTGIGDITIGSEFFEGDEYLGDFVVGLNGSLKWDNIILLPVKEKGKDNLIPGLPLGLGDINGDMEIRIDLLTLISLLPLLFAEEIDIIAVFLNLSFLRAKLKAENYIEINQLVILSQLVDVQKEPVIGISLDMQPGEIMFDWDILGSINGIPFFDIQSTSSMISINAFISQLGADYKIELGDVMLHDGILSLYPFGLENIANAGFEFICSLNPSIDLLSLKTADDENIITVANIAFGWEYLNVSWDLENPQVGSIFIDTNGKPIICSITILEDLTITGTLQTEDLLIDWNIDGDLTGHITIDSDMQDCYLTLDICQLITVTGGFRAKNWGFAWNFDGPPGTWYFTRTGTLEFIGDFSLGVNDTQEQTWYYWPEDSPPPPPEDGYIEGYVQDLYTWDPIVGATVSCLDDTTISDSNGFYQLTVNQGTHSVTATADGYESYTASITVSEGETETFNFNLKPLNTGKIQGWVKDNVTHLGIGDALITAQPGGKTVTTMSIGSNIGYFSISLVEGTYEITATMDGYEPVTLTDLVVEDGQITQVGDVYLPPLTYGGIFGYVYADDTGYGISKGMTITVEIPDGEDLVAESGISGKYPNCYPECGANQYYAFDVAPGTYTVTFEHDDYLTKTQQVTVIAGQLTEVDVTLQREWYSPNSFNDPDSDWNNEANAFDESEITCAVSNKKVVAGWTYYLYLNVPSIQCDKIRFNAFYDAEYCNKAYIEVYYNNDWYEVYDGAFANREYVEASLGSIQTVTKARVSFWIKGALTTTADLYELDFHKA